MICPKCGIEVEEGAKFCSACGAELINETEVKEAEQVANTEPEVVAEQTTGAPKKSRVFGIIGFYVGLLSFILCLTCGCCGMLGTGVPAFGILCGGVAIAFSIVNACRTKKMGAMGVFAIIFGVLGIIFNSVGLVIAVYAQEALSGIDPSSITTENLPEIIEDIIYKLTKDADAAKACAEAAREALSQLSAEGQIV